MVDCASAEDPFNAYLRYMAKTSTIKNILEEWPVSGSIGLHGQMDSRSNIPFSLGLYLEFLVRTLYIVHSVNHLENK